MYDGPAFYQGYESTGTGALDFQNPTRDWIEWKVSSDIAGLETIAFRYVLPKANRPLELKVNGVVLVPSLNFPKTASWSDWQLVQVQVPLVEGNNIIQPVPIRHSPESPVIPTSDDDISSIEQLCIHALGQYLFF